MAECIQVKNISKSFGNTKALDNVSVTFEKNKIYGLLGRNGAGKSTLLNIISNRIFADAGEVEVDGITQVDNDKALSKIYIMSENTYYPENMKISESFKYSKYFYPEFDDDFAMYAASQFDLNVRKKVKSLSTGYNSIFKLIIALSVNTPYVFLDEPVLGLDANHRELFYRILIERYSEHPASFVISTHLIEEVSGVIEDIVIIDKGRVLRSESRESLLSKGYSVSGRASLVDEFIKGKEVLGIDVLGGLKTAHVLGKAEEEVPVELEITRLDLQKLFVKLTQ